MKVLLCHTYYQQPGGEDRSFEEERQLLVDHGHQVSEYIRSNRELDTHDPFSLARTTLWNGRAARELNDLIAHQKPDVLHCTNTFPLISPAVIHQAHRRGIAVVQALRNYRLICPGSYLMRDGHPCHDCIGQAVPWPAVKHRCYRDSRSASTVVASMLMLHRALGTWRKKVDAFFTLTDFSRRRFLEAGFPDSRVHVKYNSVPAAQQFRTTTDDYLVFVGRLAPEKGVATLLTAWREDQTLPALKILGDGPLAADVQEAAAVDSRIQWLGHLEAAEVQRHVSGAKALIMPSIWYETFGRTIAEAYACGTPVIASRLGAMQELVVEDQTGLSFEPGNAADLSRQVHRFTALACSTKEKICSLARNRYETLFTPECNYQRLVEIYQIARQRASTKARIAFRKTSKGVELRADAVTIDSVAKMPVKDSPFPFPIW